MRVVVFELVGLRGGVFDDGVFQGSGPATR